MENNQSVRKCENMNEYKIINKTYWYNDPHEAILQIPCTEIHSEGEWPKYLVNDINNARIRLENHGFIGGNSYLMIPRHIYGLFKQFRLENVPAEDYLKKHHFIKESSIRSENENSVSLMAYSIYRFNFSELEISGQAIKITDVFVSPDYKEIFECNICREEFSETSHTIFSSDTRIENICGVCMNLWDNQMIDELEKRRIRGLQGSVKDD